MRESERRFNQNGRKSICSGDDVLLAAQQSNVVRQCFLEALNLKPYSLKRNP